MSINNNNNIILNVIPQLGSRGGKQTLPLVLMSINNYKQMQFLHKIKDTFFLLLSSSTPHSPVPNFHEKVQPKLNF